ncbi:MAG: ABC transporter ATP-binding protein [Chloroflexota bacterium]|nr:ABC transporter ATP-binding protein [Chloroflexota bacterium]
MNIVEMRAIIKRFGQVTANDGVNFDLREGEIHALLGENGAGKTTLMRILYGLYHQDTGDIIIGGQPAEIHSPKDAIALGVGMVTQHFALVTPLSVAENVVLGFTTGFRLQQAVIEQQVAEAAARFGLEIDPTALVRHLSVGEKQRVEILKALYRHARVLILDEPTAVLIPQEVEVLFQTLERLCAEGLSVIFISHKLDEVMTITDRVTVLRDGRVVGTVNTEDVSQLELARMMVGRESFGVTRSEESQVGTPVLQLQELSAVDDQNLPALKSINLTIGSGEILGIAGVGGNGQTELAEVLSGIRVPTAGKILLHGQNLAGLTPAQFSAARMGRIPEDRHKGVVNALSVAENLALEHLTEFIHHGTLDRQAIYSHADELIAQFQIKARPTDRIRTLSGGNMQKVLLARVLAREPEVVIAPQPTRGLDVGATDYVREQLLEQRARGAAVLLISEDLDEILAISDRIAVMYEGEIVGVLPVHAATVEQLGLLMSGAVKERAAL